MRESNPPRRLERAVSCTDRRTGRLGAYLSRMRAIRRAHLSRSGLGGARIRVCGFSGRRYTICGYRPNEKSPMSCDTGLWISSGNWRPGVTSAMDTGRAYSPAVGRQSAPYRIVRVIYSTKNTFLTRSSVVVAFAGTTRISARRPALFHLRRFSAANGSRKIAGGHAAYVYDPPRVRFIPGFPKFRDWLLTMGARPSDGRPTR